MPTRSRNNSSKGTTKESKKATSRKTRAANPDYVFERLQEEYGSLDGVSIDDSLDLVIYSHLLLHLPFAESIKAYRAFKAQFVDWNEVRISTAKDVQDVVRHGDAPLELAIFLKEFLDRLFHEYHHVGLEFIRELNISEIRSFFKKSPGFAESTVHLLVQRTKEYPVLPLEGWMQPCLERLGLVSSSSS